SGDGGLKDIEQYVRNIDAAMWNTHRERITATFSDDALRAKVPGMLRGGRPITYEVEVGVGKKLTISFSVDGSSSESQLSFKDTIEKYEFEHSSDPTSVIGSFSEGRLRGVGGVTGNVTHANVTWTSGLLGAYDHDWTLVRQRADRQISG